MYRVSLKAHNADEETVVHEVQTKSALQQHSTTRVTTDIEPDGMLSYRPAETERSETVSSALVEHFSSYIYKRVVQSGTKNLMELPSCEKFNIEAI